VNMRCRKDVRFRVENYVLNIIICHYLSLQIHSTNFIYDEQICGKMYEVRFDIRVK
jgi:hypothetical protein